MKTMFTRDIAPKLNNKPATQAKSSLQTLHTFALASPQ